MMGKTVDLCNVHINNFDIVTPLEFLDGTHKQEGDAKHDEQWTYAWSVDRRCPSLHGLLVGLLWPVHYV